MPVDVASTGRDRDARRIRDENVQKCEAGPPGTCPRGHAVDPSMEARSRLLPRDGPLRQYREVHPSRDTSRRQCAARVRGNDRSTRSRALYQRFREPQPQCRLVGGVWQGPSRGRSRERAPKEGFTACPCERAAADRRCGCAARLQKAAFGEAHDRVASHDKVVEDANLDEGERVLHSAGDQFIRLGWLGNA